MKNGQAKPDPKSLPADREGQLLVADIARYLSGLAKLQDSVKTGNPALSEGLRSIAQALRPYAHCPASDLPAALQQEKAAAAISKAAPDGSKAAFPPEVAAALESLSQEEVAQILDDPGSAKQLVAELGFRRFGISRAKLERLSKPAARAAVRAALEHEKSLDVIAQQARKSGQARRG